MDSDHWNATTEEASTESSSAAGKCDSAETEDDSRTTSEVADWNSQTGKIGEILDNGDPHWGNGKILFQKGRQKEERKGVGSRKRKE